jgi:hypothetical protein
MRLFGRLPGGRLGATSEANRAKQQWFRPADPELRQPLTGSRWIRSRKNGEDPAVIQRILTHLGLSLEAGEALPAARASPSAESLSG